jgi:hypothetical protein
VKNETTITNTAPAFETLAVNATIRSLLDAKPFVPIFILSTLPRSKLQFVIAWYARKRATFGGQNKRGQVLD